MLKQKLSSILKKRGLKYIYASILAFWMGNVMADGQSLSDIVGTVQGNVQPLGPFLTIVSYICGVGFAIAGIIKFKTHKENPQQATLSQAIVYVLVGAALLFLPSIMTSAGSTIFGSGQALSGKTGSNLP